MRAALFLFVLAGAGIGVLLPTKAPPAAPATPPRAASEAPRDNPIETILDRQEGHYFTYADVNDQPVRFMVDTGASMVALTLDDARRIGVKFDPNTFEHIASGASGPVYGKRLMLGSVTLDGSAGSANLAPNVNLQGVSALPFPRDAANFGLNRNLVGANFRASAPESVGRIP